MRRTTVLAALFVTAASLASAGPRILSYQGDLVGAGGQPVADGPYAMRFTLYDAPTAGLLRWTETDGAVEVVGGGFATILGDGTPFTSQFTNSFELWLEVEIDLDADGFEPEELYTPRTRLAGSAWAVEADRLLGKSPNDFAASGHDHDAAYWSVNGNAGTNSGTHFLGTSDNVALDLRVNNARALRLEPATSSPNLIGGYDGNAVSPGVRGATIGGGGRNGQLNRVTGDYGTIGGGVDNTTSGTQTTIAGGYGNSAGGNWSTIGGGVSNSATSYGATIGGGQLHWAGGPYATVGGGRFNQATGNATFIGGGEMNKATQRNATIAGGNQNTASGYGSFVGCGERNTVSGNYASIPNGLDCKAAGERSFAAGVRAEALHSGAFVWADNSVWQAVQSTGDNQFLVRAAGGMMLTPNSGALNPQAQLQITMDSHLGRPHVYLLETQTTDYARLRLACSNPTTHFWDIAARQGVFNIYYRGDSQDILQLLPDDAVNLLYMRNGARLTNGGAWTNASDRNAKENFAAVDGRQVLERLADVPVQTWNYRSETESTRRMGPTAQDFHAAFGLGDSDKSISTVDADGVAFAAIQGMYEIVQESQARIAALEADLAARQQQNADLQHRLAALEATVAALATRQAVTDR